MSGASDWCTCAHRNLVHRSGGVGACRLAGCYCVGFVASTFLEEQTSRARAETWEEAARVVEPAPDDGMHEETRRVRESIAAIFRERARGEKP